MPKAHKVLFCENTTGLFDLLTAGSKHDYLYLDGLTGVRVFTPPVRSPNTLIFPLIPLNTSVAERRETTTFRRRTGLNPKVNAGLVSAVFHTEWGRK